MRAAIAIIAVVFASSLAGASAPENTSLIDAARTGDIETARLLIQNGAAIDTARGDGMTALHWAAKEGHLEIVSLLLDAEAETEPGTRIGSYTPLHLAARGGHASVAARLIEAGANPNAITSTSGVTPLHLAAAAIGGVETVSVLVSHGAEVNAREKAAGQTPLMFAAGSNRDEAIQRLLQAGADPTITTKAVDVLPSLALDREASKRFAEMFPELRDAQKSYREEYPRARRMPSAKELGVDMSPMQVQAAIRAQRDFLRSGYDVGEVNGHSLARVRPDYPGGPDVVRPPFRELLVGKTGGMTALLHASREGHTAAAVSLLDGDAEVNQVSADGTSPLLMATLNGQFDLALVFLKRGADLNLAATTDGISPLFAVLQTQWAPKSNYPQPRAQDEQESDYLDVLRALLDAGADPNVRLNTHLWYWEYGLNKMGIDLTGATPFWRAAFAQDIEAMKMLAASGAG